MLLDLGMGLDGTEFVRNWRFLAFGLCLVLDP